MYIVKSIFPKKSKYCGTNFARVVYFLFARKVENTARTGGKVGHPDFFPSPPIFLETLFFLGVIKTCDWLDKGLKSCYM